MKRNFLLLIAAIALCLLLAWMAHSMNSSRVSTSGTQPLQTESGGPVDDDSFTPRASDEQCVNLLTQANRGEALAWLNDAGTSRGVARWDKNEMIALIKRIYAAGAPAVWVVDTDKVAQTKVASQFVVQLPAVPAIRKQVFACEAQFRDQYGEDPTPDTGQKYLLLFTD